MPPGEMPSPAEETENITEWKHTQAITTRLGKSPAYEAPDAQSEHGYYQDRIIIGRDTPILGGVYLGGGEREAIVVDEKYGEILKVYDNLVAKIPNLKDTNNVLKQCFDTVTEVMPSNELVVENIGKRLAPDQKIALDSYIINKGGVCRHQALLAGYLIEKLINEEHMGGKVSIDRNEIQGKGAHAWIRYEDRDGEAYIIDPAQNFNGREEDSKDRYWNYERPNNN